MDINIRKATIKDLNKILELNKKLFELEYNLFDSTLNVDWTYEKQGQNYFVNMIKNEIVLVAIIDNIIVAYLAGSISSLNYNKEKAAELENMFILEKYRNYSIGTKLVAEFKKWCISQGVNSVKVTASIANKKAISFYIKNGFAEWDITLKCNL